jgi:Lon-like ATP-dependent protease
MMIGLFMMGAAIMFASQMGRGRITESVEPYKLLVDNSSRKKAPFMDATGSKAGSLLGDVRHDPFQSGGLGTPAHLRVEAGFVHKAHHGVLFIDEASTLRPKAQQELLTAMQEKKYPITGQSEMSSGALVRTEPVPCDFILIAAGNYADIQHMHPALRSRIRGYGYEVYMEESMADNEENQDKIARLVAQEVTKDGKIPQFTAEAVDEIIFEARKRSGRKNRLTLKMRELGGLIRAAGDLAHEQGANVVERFHVKNAKRLSRTLEQQATIQSLESRKDYQVFLSSGAKIGKVNGLAVMGDAGIALPIVAEAAPASSKEEGKIIATGKLGKIAEEAVKNVGAIIKKHLGKDTASYDIHVQFLQTYEGVEGDSASISVATAVISAIEDAPVRQDVAMTGSLSVRGDVLPVGGVTQKAEAAIDAGIRTVIVPKANAQDIILDKGDRQKLRIIPVSTFYEVLKNALAESPKKAAILSRVKRELD